MFLSFFQARCIEQKQEWGMKIKQLLMESLPNLPDKVSLLLYTELCVYVFFKGQTTN